MKVAVVGAGVVGVTTAHYLNKLGVQVSVYEAADGVAQKTSLANAGQLSYSFTDSMADPALLPKLASILMGLDPAFRMAPKLDPHFVRWALKFLVNCNSRQASTNSKKLLRIALKSAGLMQAFHDAFGDEYAYRRCGKLVLLAEQADLKTRERTLMKQQAGCDVSILAYAEALKIEPSLSAWDFKPAAVLYAPGDEVGDAFKFTQSLARSLAQKGVDFHFNCQVLKLRKEASRVVRVLTDSIDEPVDAVVICTGNSAAGLLGPLGLRLSVYPVAGYSLSLPLTQSSPVVSITALSKKLVFSRMDENIRLAGFADINVSRQAVPRRIKSLVEEAKTLAPHAADYEAAQTKPWVGYRPMTPDSLPIVGSSGIDGLYINTGHGMLGWTLCAATAWQVARQIVKGY